MPTGIELAQAWVRLTPTMEGVQGEVASALAPAGAEAEKAGEDAGDRFSSGMKAAVTVAAAAVVAGLVSVFNTGFEELKFGEQVSAQTQVLLDNTNFSMAVGQIEDYTLALAGISGVSEESLQQAGNAVLRFGDISEENYLRALDSINDLASTGKDAAGVGEMLGKALADPANAAAMLRRQGVLLNDEQKQLIDNFLAAGDQAGAQGVILDELESTYGGMAEQMGGTVAGSIDKLNIQWENMAGSLVEKLVPAISGFIDILGGVVGFLSENQEFIAAFAVLLGGVLAVAFYVWAASIWATTVALLANPVTWIILAIVALIAIIILLVANWDEVVKFLTDVWAGFVSWITDVINGFVSWWTGVWEGFVSWFTGIWDGLVSWVTDLVQGWIQWQVDIILGFMAWWDGVWSGLSSAVETVWTAIGDFIAGVWNGILDGIKGAINIMIGLINGIIDGVNLVTGAIRDGTAGVINIGRITRIPMLAKGGTITGAGYTIVGENGPELLHLPQGAQVNPDYDEVPVRGVTFNNYAPLGQSPAQALTEFANRAGGAI